MNAKGREKPSRGREEGRWFAAHNPGPATFEVDAQRGCPDTEGYAALVDRKNARLHSPAMPRSRWPSKTSMCPNPAASKAARTSAGR